MDEGDESISGDVLELLRDETRLGILRALAENLHENPEDPGMAFAELRTAVGRRDSGNFNYHLDKLLGQFVTDTDDGYRLAAAGMKVVSAIVAGTYEDHDPMGPVELEDPCPVCGASMEATYEDGLLGVRCPRDHRFRNALPPRAVEERSLSELVQLLTVKTHQDLERIVEGICPKCYAPIDWDVDVTELVGVPEVSTRCRRCGTHAEVPLSAAVLTHPDVVAFYADHDVDVRRKPPWAPVLWNAVTVDVDGEDPLRLSVAVHLDGDELVATVDGSLDVLEVDR
ncbi:MAG: hypothetical protein ACI9YT_000792 [Halobacteriales archaeon]|jgi:hypothetical protein